MMEEHGIYEPRNDRGAREESRRSRSDDLRRPERIERPRDYAQIADREARREERQRQFRSPTFASPPVETYATSGIPDRETRRQERLKRLRSSSSASESSESGPGDRYRRSSRPYSVRDRKRYYGVDYAGSAAHGQYEDGDGGGDGDGA